MTAKKQRSDIFFVSITIITVITTLFLLASQYYLYSILPVTSLVLLAFFSKFPNLALYIVIFLIPFGSYRTLGNVKVIWLLSLWLLIVMFCKLLFASKAHEKLHSNLWQLIFYYILINFLSTIFSEYKDASLVNFAKLIAAYLFVALNLFFLTDKKIFFSVLPKIIVTSISISAFLAVASHYLNLSLFREAGGNTDFQRGTGGTTDPNSLALMLTFSLPFIVNWLKSSRHTFTKVICSALIILNIFALSTTYSRSGLLMMVLVLAALFYYYYVRTLSAKSWGFLLVGLTAISIVFFIAIGTNETFSKRFSGIGLTNQDRSVERRLSYITVSWESFQNSPLIGQGTGTFIEIYGKSRYALAYQHSSEGLKRYAHNTYLEILVGTGLLGFIAYLLVLLKVSKNFYVAIQNFAQQNETEYIGLTWAYFFAFLAASLFLFMFSEIYHKYILLSIAASQIALTLSQSSRINHE
ncbi:MAG: hypothetical protein RIQ94_108 [Pseudomonadota bacterium]|jgi:O-antigen ligase